MNSINQYNQMIDSLTERGYYKRKNFAIGGGVIEGKNLGSREGFAQPGEIKPFTQKMQDTAQFLYGKDFKELKINLRNKIRYNKHTKDPVSYEQYIEDYTKAAEDVNYKPDYLKRESGGGISPQQKRALKYVRENIEGFNEKLTRNTNKRAREIRKADPEKSLIDKRAIAEYKTQYRAGIDDVVPTKREKAINKEQRKVVDKYNTPIKKNPSLILKNEKIMQDLSTTVSKQGDLIKIKPNLNYLEEKGIFEVEHQRDFAKKGKMKNLPYNRNLIMAPHNRKGGFKNTAEKFIEQNPTSSKIPNILKKAEELKITLQPVVPEGTFKTKGIGYKQLPDPVQKFEEVGKKINLDIRSNVKGGKIGLATTLATLAGTGFALADDKQNTLPKGSPGQINSEKETTEKGLPAETLPAVAAAAYKLGKPLAKGAFKVVGAPVTGIGLALNELLSEDPNLTLAGAELLGYGALAKKAGTASKLLNPRGVGRFLGAPGAIMAGTDILRRVAQDSEPNMLIDKETGEPKNFEREDASFVMPTMLDASEKTAKYAQENDISYELAFKLLYGDKTFQEGIETLKESFAVGGRVGFADGPEDPSKRKFMKIMGGLASLPIVGKFFDIGTQAPKVAEVIKRGADGIPDFIMDLIAKVKLKAEETGMKYFTGKSSDEFADVYQADDFVVTQQGNKTTIKKRNENGEMIEKDMEMEIELDPETGGVTYKEATARPDGEGKLKDVDEYIDDIDLEDMRRYTYDK